MDARKLKVTLTLARNRAFESDRVSNALVHEHQSWLQRTRKPPLIQKQLINDFTKVVFTDNIVKTNRKSNEIFRKN